MYEKSGDRDSMAWDIIFHLLTVVMFCLAALDWLSSFKMDYVTHQQTLVSYAMLYILVGILFQLIRLKPVKF